VPLLPHPDLETSCSPAVTRATRLDEENGSNVGGGKNRKTLDILTTRATKTPFILLR